MWSCFIVFYSDATESKWIIDPSFEELNNLSNNLMLITVFKSDRWEKISIEKGIDQLRTSFSV